MGLSSVLRLLAEREINFILVGGLAAVAQGAPITTLDVDIVHQRTEENIQKLLSLLREVHAVFRGDARQLMPTAEVLRGAGHQLLMTSLGPLDVLGSMRTDVTTRCCFRLL